MQKIDIKVTKNNMGWVVELLNNKICIDIPKKVERLEDPLTYAARMRILPSTLVEKVYRVSINGKMEDDYTVPAGSINRRVKNFSSSTPKKDRSKGVSLEVLDMAKKYGGDKASHFVQNKNQYAIEEYESYENISEDDEVVYMALSFLSRYVTYTEFGKFKKHSDISEYAGYYGFSDIETLLDSVEYLRKLGSIINRYPEVFNETISELVSDGGAELLYELTNIERVPKEL